MILVIAWGPTSDFGKSSSSSRLIAAFSEFFLFCRTISKRQQYCSSKFSQFSMHCKICSQRMEAALKTVSVNSARE